MNVADIYFFYEVEKALEINNLIIIPKRDRNIIAIFENFKKVRGDKCKLICEVDTETSEILGNYLIDCTKEKKIGGNF